MNTHKAHFQFLPVTSSGCEVKVRIAAKVTRKPVENGNGIYIK